MYEERQATNKLTAVHMFHKHLHNTKTIEGEREQKGSGEIESLCWGLKWRKREVENPRLTWQA